LKISTEVATLEQLQDQFHDAMTSDSADLIALLDQQGVPPQDSLLIYRNNIASSLTRALRDLYPVVYRLVGEDFFNALAREYIPTSPPRHGRMVEYGRSFPEFLRDFQPAGQLPYLGDVSNLELAWNDAFHAADVPPIDPQKISSIAAEDYPKLHIHLNPSAGLLQSPHPILEIWSTNQAGSDPGQLVDLESGPDHVLIVRPFRDVLIQRLPMGAWVFTTALQFGQTLAAASEEAANASSDFELEETLSNLLHIGAITDLIQPSKEHAND
jgi:hypothetical protein